MMQVENRTLSIDDRLQVMAATGMTAELSPRDVRKVSERLQAYKRLREYEEDTRKHRLAVLGIMYAAAGLNIAQILWSAFT
jgi:hypothetical protein